MRNLLLHFLLLGFSSYAQPTISKYVIGVGGQTFINGNNKLSYTLGEAVVGAMTDESGSYQLGNGYYPSLSLSSLNTEILELKLQLKVFPNPSAGLIFMTHPTEQIFEVRITDLGGKQILHTTHQIQKPLNVQILTTGQYFLTVTTIDSKQANTYKIIKN